MIQPAALKRHQNNILGLVGTTGTIVGFTRIHNSPRKTIHRTPYYVAIIEREDGEKMTVEICREHEEHVQIGAKVQLVTRKHHVSTKGLITYNLKAKVVE